MTTHSSPSSSDSSMREPVGSKGTTMKLVVKTTGSEFASRLAREVSQGCGPEGLPPTARLTFVELVPPSGPAAEFLVSVDLFSHAAISVHFAVDVSPIDVVALVAAIRVWVGGGRRSKGAGGGVTRVWLDDREIDLPLVRMRRPPRIGARTETVGLSLQAMHEDSDTHGD